MYDYFVNLRVIFKFDMSFKICVIFIYFCFFNNWF